MSIERHSHRENSTEEDKELPKWLACSRPGKQWRMAKGKVYGEIKRRESKLKSDYEKKLCRQCQGGWFFSLWNPELTRVCRGEHEFHRILIGE